MAASITAVLRFFLVTRQVPDALYIEMIFLKNFSSSAYNNFETEEFFVEVMLHFQKTLNAKKWEGIVMNQAFHPFKLVHKETGKCFYDGVINTSRENEIKLLIPLIPRNKFTVY